MGYMETGNREFLLHACSALAICVYCGIRIVVASVCSRVVLVTESFGVVTLEVTDAARRLQW